MCHAAFVFLTVSVWHCKRPPFSVRKTAFYNAICRVLDRKQTRLFRLQMLFFGVVCIVNCKRWRAVCLVFFAVLSARRLPVAPWPRLYTLLYKYKRRLQASPGKWRQACPRFFFNGSSCDVRPLGKGGFIVSQTAGFGVLR